VIFGPTLRHHRGDIYRALLEGVGYSIRHNLETMTKEGAVVRRILALGGGTLNSLWMQIISDIAAVELRVPAEQIGAPHGDAFLAGVGIGLFKDTTEAAQWVNVGRIVRPEQAAHAIYNDFYSIYRDFYEQTATLMEKIGRLDLGGAVQRC
jgi:xylulokinase